MNKEIKTLSLRPNKFEDFIGQRNIVETLKIVIESSKKQNKILDHILFYGSAGLGKTTLANIVANYSNKNIIHVQGSLLISKSDILSIFASVKQGDIIFIDEIHSMHKSLEELIYSALEDFVLDISIGPEGEKKIVRMKVNEFTLIGATTKIGILTKPIKDRFGLIFKLEKYTQKDIIEIIINSAKKLDMILDEKQAEVISLYTNFTPRLVNRLVKRINDFKIFYNEDKISNELIWKVFKKLSLHKYGLGISHIEYLNLLNKRFQNQSVSIDIISSLLNEEKNIIIEDIEALLLNWHLIIKNSKGRKITEKGLQYLENCNKNPFLLINDGKTS
ncbi:MAG: Holliday junction branch migration DNA helicase RuvB [Metamycoplasmataceae bacterium]